MAKANYACVLYLDDKVKYYYEPIESIFYKKSDENHITPKDVQDFDAKHKYYVVWNSNKDVKSASSTNDNKKEFYEAYIICLGESEDDARRKGSNKNKRLIIPKKLTSSDSSEHLCDTQEEKKPKTGKIIKKIVQRVNSQRTIEKYKCQTLLNNRKILSLDNSKNDSAMIELNNTRKNDDDLCTKDRVSGKVSTSDLPKAIVVLTDFLKDVDEASTDSTKKQSLKERDGDETSRSEFYVSLPIGSSTPQHCVKKLSHSFDTCFNWQRTTNPIESVYPPWQDKIQGSVLPSSSHMSPILTHSLIWRSSIAPRSQRGKVNDYAYRNPSESQNVTSQVSREQTLRISHPQYSESRSQTPAVSPSETPRASKSRMSQDSRSRTPARSVPQAPRASKSRSRTPAVSPSQTPRASKSRMSQDSRSRTPARSVSQAPGASKSRPLTPPRFLSPVSHDSRSRNLEASLSETESLAWTPLSSRRRNAKNQNNQIRRDLQSGKDLQPKRRRPGPKSKTKQPDLRMQSLENSQTRAQDAAGRDGCIAPQNGIHPNQEDQNPNASGELSDSRSPSPEASPSETESLAWTPLSSRRRNAKNQNNQIRRDLQSGKDLQPKRRRPGPKSKTKQPDLRMQSLENSQTRAQDAAGRDGCIAPQNGIHPNQEDQNPNASGELSDSRSPSPEASPSETESLAWTPLSSRRRNAKNQNNQIRRDLQSGKDPQPKRRRPGPKSKTRQPDLRMESLENSQTRTQDAAERDECIASQNGIHPNQEDQNPNASGELSDSEPCAVEMLRQYKPKLYKSYKKAGHDLETVIPERYNRYEIRTNKVYLGENIRVGQKSWRIMNYKRKSGFLRDLGTVLWTKKILARRCLDISKLKKKTFGTDPIQLFTPRKLDLYLSLYSDYLNESKRYRNLPQENKDIYIKNATESLSFHARDERKEQTPNA